LQKGRYEGSLKMKLALGAWKARSGLARTHNRTLIGPQPAWDNRGGEEFSERGPNFFNYVQ